jgi:hypothetical protein
MALRNLRMQNGGSQGFSDSGNAEDAECSVSCSVSASASRSHRVQGGTGNIRGDGGRFTVPPDTNSP